MAKSVLSGIAKRFAERHNASEAKYKVTQSLLQKVGARGQQEWKEVPFPGASDEPWVEARIQKFLAGLEEERPGPDEDLYPDGHPLHQGVKLNPWDQLICAERHLSELAKCALANVTRSQLQQQGDNELEDLHQRIYHLYQAARSGTVAKQMGVTPDQLVASAALVQEELERRRHVLSPTDASALAQELYKLSADLRSHPTADVQKGEVRQTAEAVEIVLGDSVLRVANTQHVPVAKAADCWSPDGSRFHPAFVEPMEATYTALPAVSADGDVLGTFEWCPCAKTDKFTEVYVSGAMNGCLIVGDDVLMLRKSLLPYVLTSAAVASGWVPPAGESALPPSLEADVPPEYRFWKAAVGEDPKAIRDQFVATGLLREETVALVDGKPRRTFAKFYVAEPYEAAPHVFAKEQPPPTPPYHALFKAMAQDGAEPLVAFTSGLAKLDAHIAQEGPTPFLLISSEDTPAARSILQKYGRPFRSGSVLCAASRVPAGCEVDWLDLEPEGSLDEAIPTQKRAVRLLKSASPTEGDVEEHFVLGVVLEPETFDSQNEIYSATEIRKSAHTFMAHYRHAGLQHAVLIDDHVDIVESYLAPTDLEVAGETIQKGTWLMGMVVGNDDVWEAIKAGDLTGFSIGGLGIKTPIVDGDDATV